MLNYKTRTIAADQLRPGDSILNGMGQARYLVQSAPEWQPRLYDDGPKLIRLQVHGTDYAGPMLFVADDLVHANVLVGHLRIRVQALKPTDTRGQRFRCVITTADGHRVQRTVPRDYSWSATFPAKDAARAVAQEWYQSSDVDVTALYGNLTPGSTTFAVEA